MVRCGSSPQARGTHDQSGGWKRCDRFIPAGAGNTVRFVVPAPNLAVHPRRRGEHTVDGAWLPSSSGSSPQARGTRWMQVGHHLRNRFIPAGAGNTDLGKAPEIKGTVHPRRRGEHIAGLGAPNLRTGSSPQARGTRSVWQPVATQNRFIPAGAGNTNRCIGCTRVSAVHPRRRGEH